MAYKYRELDVVAASPSEIADGWANARLVFLVELGTHIRINAGLKTDEDIGDAVQKAASALDAVSPVKISALKVG